MEDALLKKYPAQITAKEQNIENYTADERRLVAGTVNVSEGISPMVIEDVIYSNRNEAGETIREACKKFNDIWLNLDTESRREGTVIGTYRGFDLHLTLGFGTTIEYNLTVKGNMPYPVKLEDDFSTQGVITRIDNVLDKYLST